MRILAHDKRTCTGVILTVLLTIPIRHIHDACNVRFAVLIIVGPLVLYGTRRILGLNPIVGQREIRSITSFIAQRPYNHTRMIDTALHIALVALEMRKLIILS